MNTERYHISLLQALRTAMHCYSAGEKLLIALHATFSMRRIFNDAYDAGMTPQELNEILKLCEDGYDDII